MFLESENFLKDGIDTQNTQYNQLISEIETVAIRTNAPLLLTGKTGTGKTKLAQKIYELVANRTMLKEASKNLLNRKNNGAKYLADTVLKIIE